VRDVKQRFSEWQNLAVTLNKGYSKSKKETLILPHPLCASLPPSLAFFSLPRIFKTSSLNHFVSLPPSPHLFSSVTYTHFQVLCARAEALLCVQPVMKLFKPPHVIVFANMCPQHDKWTAGRVEQIDKKNSFRGQV